MMKIANGAARQIQPRQGVGGMRHFDWIYFGFTFVCVMDWSKLLLSAKNVADSRTKRVGFKVLKRFLFHPEACNPAVKQFNPVVTVFSSDLQLLLIGGNTLNLAPMAMQCEGLEWRLPAKISRMNFQLTHSMVHVWHTSCSYAISRAFWLRLQ